MASNIEVGINLSSFGPYVGVKLPLIGIGNFGVSLQEAGFSFVSAMPYRRIWDYNDGTRADVPPIGYLEEAWNPTVADGWIAGFNELRQKAKIEDKRSEEYIRRPHIHDWVLFPGIDTCNARMLRLLQNNPGAQVIVHETDRFTNPFALYNDFTELNGVSRLEVVYEVNPGDGIDVDEIKDKIAEHQEIYLNTATIPEVNGVVIDLRHIRENRSEFQVATISRPGSPTMPLPADWTEIIEGLQAETVLVDFQAESSYELFKTLDTGNTELGQMMDCVCQTGYSGPVRLELVLPNTSYFNPNNIIDAAIDGKAYVEDKLGHIVSVDWDAPEG